MFKTLNLDITLFKNADFQLIITIPGVTDVSAYTFEGMIRDSTDDTGAPLASFTFTPRDQTMYPGTIYWQFPAATSNTLLTSTSYAVNPWRLNTPYLYDILMTDNLGAKSRIIQGTAFLSPNTST